eukprot:GHVN01042093.1.p3 GENE.GHVN01042093.1~~GHVN01042093.1.p3  ORF type:complete len:120 (-),score=14.62 GHVN01042093.1:534-893(-)
MLSLPTLIAKRAGSCWQTLWSNWDIKPRVAVGSVYFEGATELRNGLAGSGGSISATPDTLKAMNPDMLFDFFAVRLNPEKAEGKVMRLNFDFTDLKTQDSFLVENSVMNHSRKIAASLD